jgi:hypothetical protein
MEGMVSQARPDLRERWVRLALRVRGENQVSVERGAIQVLRVSLGRRATAETRVSEAFPERRVSEGGVASKVLLEKPGLMEVQVSRVSQDPLVQPVILVRWGQREIAARRAI